MGITRGGCAKIRRLGQPLNSFWRDLGPGTLRLRPQELERGSIRWWRIRRCSSSGQNARVPCSQATSWPIPLCWTETAVENYGTMCGAVQSGQRAAIEALEELKPQCLSSRDMALLCRKPTKLHKSSSNNLVSQLPGEPVMYSNVFRWTIVMPCLGIGAALLAVQVKTSIHSYSGHTFEGYAYCRPCSHRDLKVNHQLYFLGNLSYLNIVRNSILWLWRF